MKALAAFTVAGALLATPALAEEATLVLTDDAAAAAETADTTDVGDTAEAQDIPPSPPPDDDGIHVVLMPYAWLAGVSGPANVNDTPGPGPGPLPPIDIESDSSSVFDDLNFFGFAVGEISKGSWGVAVDVAYVDFTFDGSTVNLPLGVTLEPELDLKGSVSTIEGFYRFNVAEDVDVDAMAGVKFFWIDLALDLNGPLGLLQGSREDTWSDFAVGARVRWTPGRWTLTGQADAGFGDNTSDWGVILLADYRFTEHFGIVGGYRWLEFDYTKNGRDINLTLNGPIIGATIRF